jgi:hypothetical protein
MPSTESELDRLQADSYLDGVATASLDDIRSMRAECQAAEASLSYLRRLAQGRLDIVHAYLDRPDSGSTPELSELVDGMSRILSNGPGRPAGPGRLPMLLAPDTEDPGLTEELDSILGADEVGQLSTLGPDELGRIAADLGAYEQRVSAQRKALHERIDTLQAELVDRYKTGSATVDGLLS